MKIGVTGHQERVGIDWNWVRAQIIRFLVGKTSLIGYSSLAVGADQIFADAILNRHGDIVAVIPLANYASYFEGEALVEYDRLLSLARIVELGSIKSDSRAFLDAGKWIAREVDCVVAIWDGDEALGAGGTGDIVSYALSLGRAVHHINPITRAVSDL